MPAVASTAIRRIEHDETARRLRVEFNSSELYEYRNVPRATYEAFVSAPSKGRFFPENIRDHFSFEHLN